jgi:hypothetical protein
MLGGIVDRENFVQARLSEMSEIVTCSLPDVGENVLTGCCAFKSVVRFWVYV